MNVPQTSNANEGSFSSVVQFPWPWPPAKQVMLSKQKLDDGAIFEISIQAAGSLTTSLSDASGGIIEATTCPLKMPVHAAASLIIIWKGGSIEIFINNTLVGASKNQSKIPTEYVIPENRHNASAFDFTQENESAIRTRRDMLAGFMGSPSKLGNAVRGDNDWIFESLRDEYLQLRDLLPALHGGQSHHVPGICSTLHRYAEKHENRTRPH